MNVMIEQRISSELCNIIYVSTVHIHCTISKQLFEVVPFIEIITLLQIVNESPIGNLQ